MIIEIRVLDKGGTLVATITALADDSLTEAEAIAVATALENHVQDELDYIYENTEKH